MDQLGGSIGRNWGSKVRARFRSMALVHRRKYRKFQGRAHRSYWRPVFILRAESGCEC